MKRVELLKIMAEGLKKLSQNDVMRDDYKFVPMYEEFKMLRQNGVKYRAAIRMLSEDYHISRATVERTIRRLDGDC